VVAGVDPLIVRAAFLIAAMVGGLGLIVYLALAATATVSGEYPLLMEGDDHIDARRTRLWIGGLAATALAGGALALCAVLFDWPVWIAPAAMGLIVALTVAGGLALGRRG
jgi:uncharacterized membrane protein